MRAPDAITAPGVGGAPNADERLIEALPHVVARVGYLGLTVVDLIAEAGVSRASFYQYFADVEDCFLTSYREHAARLTAHVRASASGGVADELTILKALVDFAGSSPMPAALLMGEGLAAGAEGILERDALIAEVALALERSAAGRSGGRGIDLPEAVLIGGVFRFLALRIAQGDSVEGCHDDVEQWARAFAKRAGESAWAGGFAPSAPSAGLPRTSPPVPRILREGPRRERLIHATAVTIQSEGYAAATVANIVATAGMSRRAFYNEFHSKAEACIAACEHGFQEALAVSTPAFFSARGWPERVWSGAQAFTGYFSREPTIAHLGFVECYAIGPCFSSRLNEMIVAFTLFLEDGYRRRPQAEHLSRGISLLTATSLFEAGFQASRWDAALHMRRMQPLAVYIALAPFCGADHAGAFVTEKLAEGPDCGPGHAA